MVELSNRYKRVKIGEIQVNRDERQRSEINVDDLIDSIGRIGVLNPIIVTRDLVLIAGERRLTAAKALNLSDIPVRFADELSQTEAQIIELEENLKRKELPWRDEVKAVGRLHKLYSAPNPDWSQVDTARAIGVKAPYVSQVLRVFSELDSPKIASATGIIPAYNVLSRVAERVLADAMSDIIEAGVEMWETPQPSSTTTVESIIEGGHEAPTTSQPAKTKIIPPEESILNVDFTTWVKTYEGKPFNFIHCDFPYGIDVFKGTQAGKQRWESYVDSPDIYWHLIGTLCDNLDRVMAHSGHIMFWLAGDIEIQAKTLDVFRKLAPSLAWQNYPLYWMKSDNVGLLPDPKRGPRRVVETALIGSREDRLIVKAVGNGYHAPTNKEHHPSTKPEPVLRHFFSMFCDENSTMLDPTCGGGSSLRAAESLGATRVLGLEVSEEYCTNARSALRHFRALRSINK